MDISGLGDVNKIVDSETLSDIRVAGDVTATEIPGDIEIKTEKTQIKVLKLCIRISPLISRPWFSSLEYFDLNNHSCGSALFKE